MEDFVKLLSGKLPKDKIESGMILSIVRNEKISDKLQLANHFQNQELECRKWLAENKGPTMNSRRRDYTRKLKEIKEMREALEGIWNLI